MRNRIKTILPIIAIFLLFIIFSTLALPTNPVNPGTTSPILNSDGSLSISGNTSLPSQVGIKSLNDNNYVYITGPDNTTITYRITLMGSPTNGVLVGIVSNVTNVVLSSVSGVTQNIDVLVAGGTTNRLFISNGIITNMTVSL